MIAASGVEGRAKPGHALGLEFCSESDIVKLFRYCIKKR
jgi:hypothetical protein